jgi:hypothetical protein
MDGKGAWRDNVFVERLWRTVKYALEWIPAVRLSWRLQDQLTGLVRIGADLLPNSQPEAILMHGLNLERHYYDSFLDQLAADQEKRWLDYGRRLMDDPDAAFDAEGLPQ